MIGGNGRVARWTAIASALAAALVISGCTGEDKAAPALVNQPPYWCDLVPKQAVVEIQRLDDDKPLGAQEFTAGGVLSRDDYECGVAIHEQARNVLALKVFRDEVIRDEMPGMFIRTRVEPTPVPPSRGRGKASLDAGWVLWRCGDHDVLIYLSLHDTSYATRDLEPQVIRLLEIAQQRYAELAGCEVRPPSITPSPTT